MRFLPLLFILVLLTGISEAQEGAPLDVTFDKTGDGLVDAADWGKMSEEEKAAYANASIGELGENIDTEPEGGASRSRQYLDGLKSVYED